jgi:hypothetical protein
MRVGIYKVFVFERKNFACKTWEYVGMKVGMSKNIICEREDRCRNDSGNEFLVEVMVWE